MVAGVLRRGRIRRSINNKLYLAELLGCELAALPGDCREYKGRMTADMTVRHTKIESRAVCMGMK